MTFLTPTIQRFIHRIALPAVLALMAAFGSATSHAAGSAPLPFAAYQLSIEYAAAFRLTTFNVNAPAIESRDQPVISLRFANQRFAKLIDEASRKAALDPALVHAVIAVESDYNPAARSAKGAIGLMQVLPSTASRYGVSDPASSPEANLRAGTRYLRYLMTLFDNRLELVLAAYNAGENAVLRYGHRIPPFRETQQYVPAVLSKYREWQEPAPPVLPVTSVPVTVQYMSGTALDFGSMDAAIYHAKDVRRP
jgi:soluble lytic murein transglycosylase-like protein